MVITIDTNTLIWGLKKQSTQGQEDWIPRCARFLQWIDEHHHTLVLTSECVAEYLVSDGDTDAELRTLSSKFQIYDYDVNAAVFAAEIRKDKDFVRSLKENFGKTHVCIKSDIVIVATAKAHDVEKIYSNDEGVRKAAARCGLPASDIPTIDDMAPLPSIPKAQPKEDKPTSPVRTLFDDDESAPPASDTTPSESVE